jgi:CheY-like chemotaxis protein
MRKGPHTTSTRPCILIVEDDAPSRELLQEMLAAQGFRVQTARDGQEALACLADPADLVLTDLQMPRLDGIGLLKTLKARGVPSTVIVMSAYATIETAVEATKDTSSSRSSGTPSSTCSTARWRSNACSARTTSSARILRRVTAIKT